MNANGIGYIKGTMSPRGSGIIVDSKNGLNFVYKPGGEEKKGGWVDEPPAQGKEWSVTGRVFTSKADLSGCYVKTNKDLLSPDSFEKIVELYHAGVILLKFKEQYKFSGENI